MKKLWLFINMVIDVWIFDCYCELFYLFIIEKMFDYDDEEKVYIMVFDEIYFYFFSFSFDVNGFCFY